jgi:D-Tyr-tRNAtyr deacylase
LFSILDLPGSILVIPQAFLDGKMKGKLIQYHKNIEKDKGLEFYDKLVNLCKKYANEHSKWSTSGNKIFNGTYGIRQVYSTETNGPFFHLIEF